MDVGPFRCLEEEDLAQRAACPSSVISAKVPATPADQQRTMSSPETQTHDPTLPGYESVRVQSVAVRYLTRRPPKAQSSSTTRIVSVSPWSCQA